MPDGFVDLKGYRTLSLQMRNDAQSVCTVNGLVIVSLDTEGYEVKRSTVGNAVLNASLTQAALPLRVATFDFETRDPIRLEPRSRLHEGYDFPALGWPRRNKLQVKMQIRCAGEDSAWPLVADVDAPEKW